MKNPLVVAIAMVLLATPPLFGAKCDTDAVPAATLLYPYFEVDLDDPGGRTTLIAINNRSAEPALAKVVFWTDFAIPTLDFEIYLSGQDIQTLNLRDVFVSGRLPQTGSAVSPHPKPSEPPVQFPGCNDGTIPGASPVYPDPAIAADELAELRAFHAGDCSPISGLQAGALYTDDNIARGYITVDVVTRCSDRRPSDAGYFGAEGVAGDRNTLTGDFFLVDTRESFAQGETAVHVEAFPGEFAPGDYTFYKRYVDGSAIDNREPLGTQYEVRHLLGGAFDGGTRLLVWRDTGSPDAQPLRCGDSPAWHGGFGFESYRVFFNEEGDGATFGDSCGVLPPCPPYPLTRATQKVAYHSDEPQPTFGFGRPFLHPDKDVPLSFGKTYLVLRRPVGPSPEDWIVLQGWVSAINSAEGRYSVGQRAIRLDSACDPGPIEPVPEDFR